jgi:RNA-directed DNA polymerase
MCVPSVPASGLSNIFSYKAIHRNYLKCRKNKRNSINALKFEINAEENILNLERQLKNKSYHPSRCILFTAQKPKVREIFASDFCDRVIHHLLIEKLTEIWEPIFINDSYACREGKGTHKAVVRLQKFLRQITKNGNMKAYYLQLDIKDFFISINKDILLDLIKSKVKDPEVLWLVKETILWDCTKDYSERGNPKLRLAIPSNKSLFGKNNERGLPIGNLTSQFFANIYLNELDQFVKHTLKAKYYIRYVDDFVILGHHPGDLKQFKYRIESFLVNRLKLTLHPKRQKLLPVSSGIDFLGYIVRQDYTLVRNRVLNNFKSKLGQFNGSSPKDFSALKTAFASYLGHFKWANSHRLKNRLTNVMDEIASEQFNKEMIYASA